mmetsp:Transcript_63297/g.119871  ORF Transcript_63297/g.119871 Transcript_63297/m.119871 type:complete len:513 (-) Transcript_63297:130-1668(-)
MKTNLLLPSAAIDGKSGVPRAFTSASSAAAGLSIAMDAERDEEEKSLIREGAHRGDFLQFFVSGTSFRSAYTVEHKIGEGAFGKVFAARHKTLDILRAVKRLKKSRATCDMRKNELAALLLLDHPHIVKLVEYYDEEDDYLYLVFELCAGPDLSDYIHKQPNGIMNEYTAAVALRHMLKALQCCHAHYRGHFDVKPENFMYTNSDCQNLKMIDLGLSSGFEQKAKIRGTAEYMAPEFWDGIYGPEGDVWSCGIALFHMLTGEDFLSDVQPREMKREIKVRARIRSRIAEVQTRFGLSTNAVDLLTRMLQHDRHGRPTARECLTHVFITESYEHKLEARLFETALRIRERLPELCRAAAAEPMLKRVARLAVAHAAQPSPAERLVFRMLDKHGYGEISIGVWEYDFVSRGAAIPEDLEALFESVDLNRDGYIGSLSFLAVMLPASVCNDVNVCRVAFGMLDRGGDGFIDADDLASTFGHASGSPSCQNVLGEVSADGHLSFENFVQLMHVDDA